jgi:hypothetical protein
MQRRSARLSIADIPPAPENVTRLNGSAMRPVPAGFGVGGRMWPRCNMPLAFSHREDDFVRRSLLLIAFAIRPADDARQQVREQFGSITSSRTVNKCQSSALEVRSGSSLKKCGPPFEPLEKGPSLFQDDGLACLWRTHFGTHSTTSRSPQARDAPISSHRSASSPGPLTCRRRSASLFSNTIDGSTGRFRKWKSEHPLARPADEARQQARARCLNDEGLQCVY